MADNNEPSVEKSNIEKDLDRIEKMFNKTIWLVGILITVFISGSVIAFVTLYNSVTATAKDAKYAIEKNVSDMSHKITDSMSERIDVKKMEQEIKEKKLSEITNILLEDLNKSKSEIENKLSVLYRQMSDLDEKVNQVKESINKFYTIQDIAKDSSVRISSLDPSITYPKFTEPFNINYTLYAPDMPEANVLNVFCEVLFQNTTFSQNNLIKGKSFLKASIAISPKQMIRNSDNEVQQKPGKYACELRVYTIDKQRLLAQESTYLDMKE